MKTKQIINFLEQNSIDFEKNASFKNFCTYRLGGKILLVIYPFNNLELLKVLNLLNNPFFVIGCGSKLLPSDKTFKTPVIKLCGEFEGFTCENNVLKAYAGVTVARLLNYCKINGFSGLEFLVGIPATVGGAIVMNAGTNRGEIKNNIVSVDAFVKQNNKWVLKTFNADECEFDYRNSKFKNMECVVVSASFKVVKTTPSEVINLCSTIIGERLKQPKGFSCGSIFKKNLGISAGKLIDECGLKGLQYKQAKISESHANFFVNLKNAKSKHIKHLIDVAQNKVKKQKGVTLETEVIILGEKIGDKNR